jgi:hypothetical protein
MHEIEPGTPGSVFLLRYDSRAVKMLLASVRFHVSLAVAARIFVMPDQHAGDDPGLKGNTARRMAAPPGTCASFVRFKPFRCNHQTTEGCWMPGFSKEAALLVTPTCTSKDDSPASPGEAELACNIEDQPGRAAPPAGYIDRGEGAE